MIARRDFLKGLVSTAVLGRLPEAWGAAAGQPRRSRRLLLVELSGGNDGLNTVVPYRDSLYRELRPTIAIPRDAVLPLDEQLGLHPALEPLLPLFRANELAIIQGVGYDNPNRSHFRSIEIWDTGSGSAAVWRQGWLTRVGTRAAVGPSATVDAVVIGRNPGPVSGGSLEPVVITSVESFVRDAEGSREETSAGGNPALARLVQVENEIARASRQLTASRTPLKTVFPANPFGRDVAEAARILAGEPMAPIVKVALAGFDTHARQTGPHERQLRIMAGGLAAFRNAMIEAGSWNDVLVMIYSEFGRRARENASHGTDHGCAAPLFLAGGRVKGGLHGLAPDLSALMEGDIPATLDYRRVYNTVLRDWWGRGEQQIERSRFRPVEAVLAV